MAGQAHDSHEHHIISPGVYLSIFAALMVLTVITVWAAFHDWGKFNVLIALGIAGVKATLVILFFMHVKYSSKLTQMIVVTGLFFFLIMIALTFADYLTRG